MMRIANYMNSLEIKHESNEDIPLASSRRREE
jgi:hypothetical protein